MARGIICDRCGHFEKYPNEGWMDGMLSIGKPIYDSSEDRIKRFHLCKRCGWEIETFIWGKADDE